MRIDKNTTIRLGDRNIVKIKIGDSVIWQKTTGPVVGPDYFYIESLGDGNTLSVINEGSGDTYGVTPTLEYSTDKNTWNTITFDWTSGTHTTELPIALNTGEKMYFRNDTRKFSNSYYKCISFSSSVSSNVGGDIRTLSNYLDVDNETTVQSNMFRNLFKNNKYIVDASNLRFSYTRLADYCYGNMFYGCTSLTIAPELPATTIASNCYSYMFGNCTNLTTAPELPATIMREYCYSSMFFGCIKLTTAPALPATTLAEKCYQYMFQNCTSLNNVTVYANDISATNCTYNWLDNVASSGTFNNYGSATYTANSSSGIPTGWTEVKPVVEPEYFYIESLGDGNTISVKNEGNGSTDNVTPTLEYSTDKNTWNTITFDWTSGNHTTELPVKLNTGGKMYFRNDTRKFSNLYNKYISFSPSVSSNVGGDIRTLSNYLDVDNETKPQSYMFCYLFKDNKYIVDASNLRLPYTTLASSCYIAMFWGCSSLTTAPALPATSLASSCYSSMFSGCSSLTTAPALPATTLASNCYSDMFTGCNKLTSAPTLPATSLASSCYQYMFQNCSKLTTAPALPATSLASSCYSSMFSGCSSLTTAPKLPATTLENSCYNAMFGGCSSLTTAPELPATTLADYCYQYMFQNCSKLTTAPALPATTLKTQCYDSMFYGCTSLTSVTIYATSTSYGSFAGWLNNVAPSGTVYNNGSISLPKNSPSGIPSGWTEVKN